MKTVLKAGLAAAAVLVAGALPASAQSRVQVGTLTCNMAPNVAFIIGSVREMSCTFRPAVWWSPWTSTPTPPPPPSRWRSPRPGATGGSSAAIWC